MAKTHRPSAVRSATMRAVRSRDTEPELLVARLLRAEGARFRRNVAGLPGSPDFVVTPRRGCAAGPLAVFVHGCWWHGHGCPRGARTPKTNRPYWLAKVARNRRRDRRATAALREAGYSVWVVWECRLRCGRLPPGLLGRVRAVAAGGV